MISDLFSKKFAEVNTYTPQSTSNGNHFEYHGAIMNECMYMDVVSEDEIYNIICELDPSKARDNIRDIRDNIPPYIIKVLTDYLVCPITPMVNKMIMEKEYPDQLKHAVIIPLYQ
jgi:hypothetical protein